MKKQVVVIHGGMICRSYDEYIDYLKNYEMDLERLKSGNWKEALQDDLGEKFNVILPKMPNKLNAKYLEWKIWFENFFPLFNKEVILVGTSLGGMFLSKYLAENKVPFKISQLHLIAAPLDDCGEESIGDFVIPEDIKNVGNQANNIFLYHSRDDSIVPFSQLNEYSRKLPNAKKIIFKNKGHFIEEEKIPELIENIKNN